MKKSLIILAAGMGSRFGGLKQMESFLPTGETLLDFAVYDAIRAGFDRAIFVIRENFKAVFHEVITDKFKDRIEVCFAFQTHDLHAYGFETPVEREKPWGTGHAVLVAKPFIEGPFAVINADDFYGLEAYRSIGQFFDDLERPDYPFKGVIVGYPVGRTLSEHGTVSRGVIAMNEANELLGIEEYEGILRERNRIIGHAKSGLNCELKDTDLVSVNCFGFAPEVMDSFEVSFRQFLARLDDPLRSEFYLPSAVADLAKCFDQAVEVRGVDSDWLGVTYRDDKPAVQTKLNEKIQKCEYPSVLWGEGSK